MKVSVICIGDELLKGATINTNIASIGQMLLPEGIIPFRSITVPDKPEDVMDAVRELIGISDYIITTGGLGPTADDLSKDAIAAYFGLKLKRNEEIAEALWAFWRKLGRPGEMPESNLNQAMIPEGAEILPNATGTAPGVAIKVPQSMNVRCRELAMLPGPPVEMNPMFKDYVVPRIKSFMDETLYNSLFYVVGVPESSVEQMMIPVISKAEKLSVAYCAAPGTVKVFLTSPDKNVMEDMSSQVKALFPKNLLSDGVSSIEEDIINILRAKKLKMASAESCTGGLISSMITEIPGSSDVFAGGITTYSNESKISFLGVNQKTIARHGSVSAECVHEMAMNVCEKFNAQAGVAVTGIAGPSGAVEGKPVGTVFTGVCLEGRVLVLRHLFSNSRKLVRQRTAATVLNTLRMMLLDYI